MAKLVQQPGGISAHLNISGIKDLARENAQAIVAAGHYDLLKVYVELKRYEVYLKTLIQSLQSPAFEKAKEQGKKSFRYDDALVQVTSRSKWDFSVDAHWSSLNEKINQLIEERKERERLLKEMKEDSIIVNPETGEITEGSSIPLEIVNSLFVRL